MKVFVQVGKDEVWTKYIGYFKYRNTQQTRARSHPSRSSPNPSVAEIKDKYFETPAPRTPTRTTPAQTTPTRTTRTTRTRTAIRGPGEFDELPSFEGEYSYT